MKKFCIALFIFVATLSFAQQKFALVIGNGNYTNIAKLYNPVNDATDMEAALKSLGFTVEKLLNANLDQMERAIGQLKNRLGVSKNTYGFFFYAGHGVQSGADNFLIPVDANIPSENYLRTRTLSVQTMLDELNDAGNELNVIVLDSCRDNPFSWTRSGSRGLTVVSSPPANSIIVYATRAGSTAADGTGRNGLFTSHLLNNLKIPGLEVTEVFRRTGADVARASNDLQRPGIYNEFYGTAYLGSPPAVAVQPAPQPAPAPSVQPTSSPQPTTAPQPTLTPEPASVPQPSPAPSIQPVAQPAATPERPVPANMVRINGGTFMMGSPASEVGHLRDEVQRSVTVSSFYMSKYEVTQKEYLEVMGTNPSKFKGDNLPVEMVSWYDAINYCNRLSQRESLTPAYMVNGENVTWNQNANGYRLPTEAEWEYACRAGTATPFSTGTNITTGQANYHGNYPYNNNAKGTYLKRTTAVGSFSPNPWGLYDMHGNVEEWCWDLHGNYVTQSHENKESRFSMYLVGGGRQNYSGSDRVLRGGCWNYGAESLRSAHRDVCAPSGRDNNVGFRVARNG